MSRDVANTCSAVTVGVASTVVLGINASRVSMTIVNDGATTVYLMLTTSAGTVPTAVLNSGVRLNANGGAYTQDNFQGAVSGISSAASVVTVTEI